jgi:hypothetical protein
VLVTALLIPTLCAICLWWRQDAIGLQIRAHTAHFSFTGDQTTVQTNAGRTIVGGIEAVAWSYADSYSVTVNDTSFWAVVPSWSQDTGFDFSRALRRSRDALCILPSPDSKLGETDWRVEALIDTTGPLGSSHYLVNVLMADRESVYCRYYDSMGSAMVESKPIGSNAAAVQSLEGDVAVRCMTRRVVYSSLVPSSVTVMLGPETLYSDRACSVVVTAGTGGTFTAWSSTRPRSAFVRFGRIKDSRLRLTASAATATCVADSAEMVLHTYLRPAPFSFPRPTRLAVRGHVELLAEADAQSRDLLLTLAGSANSARHEPALAEPNVKRRGLPGIPPPRDGRTAVTGAETVPRQIESKRDIVLTIAGVLFAVFTTLRFLIDVYLPRRAE